MVVFAGLATTAYFLTPVELFKYINAALIFAIGIFLAFYKYNDRTVDVWIRNLVLKLFSSSQYYYHKKNEPPSFLENIIYDKNIAVLHADAQKKLTSYLGKAGNPPEGGEEAKVPVEQHAPMVSTPLAPAERMTTPSIEQVTPVVAPIETRAPSNPDVTPSPQVPEHPALSGIVKNNKDLPLPNILVYVKNKEGQVARILKTDNHGVFSTTKPLGSDQIILEPKDSANRFFFDTLNINPGVGTPLVIRSREAL